MRAKVSEVEPRFSVGDRVLIRFGPFSEVPAIVTEDRGRLGVGGRRIYRVTTADTAPSEPVAFEVSEEDLTHRPGRRSSVRPNRSKFRHAASLPKKGRKVAK